MIRAPSSMHWAISPGEAGPPPMPKVTGAFKTRGRPGVLSRAAYMLGEPDMWVIPSFSIRLQTLFGSNLRRSEEHTSELQSLTNLVCRLLLEKKKKKNTNHITHNQ